MNRAVITPTAASHHLEITVPAKLQGSTPRIYFVCNIPGLYSTVATVSHLTGENNDVMLALQRGGLSNN